MIHINTKVKTLLQKIKPIWLIFFATVVLLIVEIFIILLFHLLNIPQGSNLPMILPTSLLEVSISLIVIIPSFFIIAPITETFIFQYLFYEGMCVKHGLSKKKFIFFSAIIFGLLHFSYWSTIFISFTICVVFNYLYAILREANSKKVFLIICSIHSLLNILAVLLKYLPHYF